MSTAATTAVPTECPECGGAMWDNRADNAKKQDGRRRPDFRCKLDRDHVIWPPSEKKGAPKSNGKQGYSAGPALPGEEPVWRTEEEKEEALRKLGVLHRRCLMSALSEAKALEEAKIGDSPEAASARCAQLFIAATKAGLHR